MNLSTITTFILVAIILLIYLLIKINKNVRLQAYKLFLKAEHEIIGGEDKMSYVVSNIHSYLPTMVKFFVSEESLKRIVQKMFDEIKDLLDDGKRNDSIRGEDYE